MAELLEHDPHRRSDLFEKRRDLMREAQVCPKQAHWRPSSEVVR
jgi:hypothetical protein